MAVARVELWLQPVLSFKLLSVRRRKFPLWCACRRRRTVTCTSLVRDRPGFGNSTNDCGDGGDGGGDDGGRSEPEFYYYPMEAPRAHGNPSIAPARRL